MISFLFDLLSSLIQGAGKILSALLEAGGRLLSAAASVLLWPIRAVGRLGDWASVSWVPAAVIAAAVLVLLLLALWGFALTTRKR